MDNSVKDYKKSYKGFVLWLLLFCAACVGVCFLPTNNAKLLSLIFENLITIATALLALIIYLTEKIYWYNGTSFEEAKRATPAQRKVFALGHLKTFSCAAILYLIYSVISYILNFSWGIDTVVVCVIIIIAACFTVKYKL